jgi:hypothetical protein
MCGFDGKPLVPSTSTKTLAKRCLRNPLVAGLVAAYIIAIQFTFIKSTVKPKSETLSATTTTPDEHMATSPANNLFVPSCYGPQFAIKVNHERLKNISLQQGNWVGNAWIPPPGWRMFSAANLRKLYKDRSILWMGDSTNRQTAYLFYAIINSDVNASWIHASDPSVRDSRDPIWGDIDLPAILDLDKYWIVPSCKRIPRELWG